MYGDTCTISKLGNIKDKYGASNPNGREVLYEDIPCKFSFTNVDNPGDGNDVYVPVLKEVRVFLDLDYPPHVQFIKVSLFSIAFATNSIFS